MESFIFTWSRNTTRPRPLHTASISEIEKISSGVITISKKSTTYVTRKIVPPVRPLLSTLVRRGIKARQEGKPIPKAKPQKMSSVATSNSPRVGKNKGNNEEIMPKMIQTRIKRILSNFSAMIGPISMEINAAR